MIAGLAGCAIVSLAGAQPAGTPATYKGLEISVAGVDRASTASLKDCPPGGNTAQAGYECSPIDFHAVPPVQDRDEATPIEARIQRKKACDATIRTAGPSNRIP